MDEIEIIAIGITVILVIAAWFTWLSDRKYRGK